MTARTPRSPTSRVRATLSIGELSEATGLGIETLRAWERRYGRPCPVRLPSGHRRYERADVAGLRLVAEAVAQGRRPSEVLSLAPAALARVLTAVGPAPGVRAGEGVEELLAHVKAYRGTELRSALRARAARLGARAFVERCAEPLGAFVGRRWAEGTLSIRHEHFATEALLEVVAGLAPGRRPRPGAPLLLFATLPGERHALGCVVAAVVARARGARAEALGADTPLAEIAAAAMEGGACGVGVSVSLATGGVSTDRRLAELRRLLPPGIALVVGGRGARGPRRAPGDVRFMADLAELEAWVDACVATSRRS